MPGSTTFNPGLEVLKGPLFTQAAYDEKSSIQITAMNLLGNYWTNRGFDVQDENVTFLRDKVSQDALDFKPAFYHLSYEGQNTLRAKLGRRNLDFLIKLSQKNDPKAFWDFVLAHAQSSLTDPLFSKTLLEAMNNPSLYPIAFNPSPEQVQRARYHLNILAGGGSFFDKAPYIAKSFLGQAFDWHVLVPIIGAGFSGKVLRTGSLSLLSRSSIKGLPATLIGGGAAFSGEVFAYTLLNRTINPELSLNFSHDLSSAAVTFGLFHAAGLGSKFLINQAGLRRIPFAFTTLPFAGQYGALLLARPLESSLGLAPALPQGDSMYLSALINLTQLHLGLGVAKILWNKSPVGKFDSRISRDLQTWGYRTLNDLARPEKISSIQERPKLSQIAGLETWELVYGSGLRSNKKPETTQDLSDAFRDAALDLLGENNVHSIIGSGSFHLYGGRMPNEGPRDVRTYDLDKKPDLVIYVQKGRMKSAIEAIGSRWAMSPERASELLDHATYHPFGPRMGAIQFNLDVLFPGFGPLGAKFAIVPAEAFFATDARGRARLEYGNIRAKDADASTLLYSIDAQAFHHQVAAIQASFLEQSHHWLSAGFLRQYLKPGKYLQNRFSGQDWFNAFYQLSFRAEYFRLHEQTNALGLEDKGLRLAEERAEVTVPLLIPEIRNYVARQGLEVFNAEGQRLEANEINSENFLSLEFRENSNVLTRSFRFYSEVPAFMVFQWRVFTSYLSHILKSNHYAQAYYQQSNAQYMGRKINKATVPKGDAGKGVRWDALSPMKRRMRSMFAWYSKERMNPIYYSNVPDVLNRMLKEEALNTIEYQILMNDWYAQGPALFTRLKNQAVTIPKGQDGNVSWLQGKALLQTLPSSTEVERSAAQKFMTYLKRNHPLLKEETVEHIDSVTQ